MTGKPYKGQINPVLLRPTDYLIVIIFALIVGISLSIFGVLAPIYSPLIIPGWILTVGALRRTQVIMVHHCAHFKFTSIKIIDKWLGRIVTILLIIREFDDYAIGHRNHHSLRKHQTSEDETIRVLLGWVRLKVGVSKQENWKALLQALCSPIFHLQFSLSRFRSCFVTSPYRLIAYSFWGAILLAVALSHSWLLFLIAWVIPAFPLYQIASALRLAAEHTLPEAEIYLARDKRYICQSTTGVFLGESIPSLTLTGWTWLIAWTKWWLRLLLVYGLIRWIVLPGDTVVHDYHSRYPGSDDWANGIWKRQAELEAGCQGWPEPYTEVWGLKNAIDVNLEALSQLSPQFLSLEISRIDVYRMK